MPNILLNEIITPLVGEKFSTCVFTNCPLSATHMHCYICQLTTENLHTHCHCNRPISIYAKACYKHHCDLPDCLREPTDTYKHCYSCGNEDSPTHWCCPYCNNIITHVHDY